MRIQFLPGDPRAGTVAQMDSSRGQQLIDAGAAVQVKDEPATAGSASAVAPVPAPTGEAVTTAVPPADVNPATLTAAGLRAALDAKSIAYKGNASKADLLALLTGQGS